MNFTFKLSLHTVFLICSHALDRNIENEHAKGILPAIARPAETPTRSCSLIPTLINLLGNTSLNNEDLVDLETSQSTTTIFSFSLPSSISISAKLSLILVKVKVLLCINLHHPFL
jgi:hypothetical protein